MKPLKIVHVTTYFHPDKFGGAERVVFELARTQKALGHDVTVVTHRAQDTEAAQWLCGIRVLRYPVNARGPAGFYRSVQKNARTLVKELLGEETFDVMHTHQILSALAMHLPKRIFKGPMTASFYAPYHQEYESKHCRGKPASEAERRPSPGVALVSRLLKAADRRVLKRSGAVIVLSEFSRSQVADLARGVLKRTRIIPAGVDLERFHPTEDKELDKHALGAPRGAPLLFTVRRLVERMGLEDLIDAAGILEKRGLPFQLVIGGDGPLSADLRGPGRGLARGGPNHLPGPHPRGGAPEVVSRGRSLRPAHAVPRGLRHGHSRGHGQRRARGRDPGGSHGGIAESGRSGSALPRHLSGILRGPARHPAPGAEHARDDGAQGAGSGRARLYLAHRGGTHGEGVS